MAIPRTPSFIGQVPVFGPDGSDEERSDFRDVPSSDAGDAQYSDRGTFGTYQTDAEPFRSPSDVKRFVGYGATESDLDRGFVEPTMREAPAYDLDNYKQRSSQPRAANDDQGETDTMDDDWKFRTRNLRSRGFLTRPRIPTERG